MKDIPNSLIFLLLSWTITTAALVALLAYRGTLSRKEDDSLYLNKAKEMILVSGEHTALIDKMNRLARPIRALTLVSGALLLATASFWCWVGFGSF